jgi:hypothetical protein
MLLPKYTAMTSPPAAAAAAAAAAAVTADVLYASLSALDAHEALAEGVTAEHSLHMAFIIQMFKQVGGGVGCNIVHQFCWAA